MRAVSITVILSVTLLASGPSIGSAQATSHAGDRAAKAGTAKKAPRVAPREAARTAVAARAKPTAPSAHPVVAKAPPAAVAPVPVPATDGASVTPTANAVLRDAPDGQPVATLSPHVTLEPVAHEHGWVRVRAEGWVKEADVTPIDSAHTVLSAADLRADPDGARGKHVRWNVEVLAMATADPLRKGLNADEPYLLARGPGSESALLYVAIPPGMVAAARALASEAPVPVTLGATVRIGRSEPVGVPILDAHNLARR